MKEELLIEVSESSPSGPDREGSIDSSKWIGELSVSEELDLKAKKEKALQASHPLLPISGTSSIIPSSSSAVLSLTKLESIESEAERDIRRSRKEKRRRSDDEVDMGDDHQEEEMDTTHKKYRI